MDTPGKKILVGIAFLYLGVILFLPAVNVFYQVCLLSMPSIRFVRVPCHSLAEDSSMKLASGSSRQRTLRMSVIMSVKEPQLAAICTGNVLPKYHQNIDLAMSLSFYCRHLKMDSGLSFSI